MKGKRMEGLRDAKRDFSWIGLAYGLYLAVSTGSQLAMEKILEKVAGNLDYSVGAVIIILAGYPLAFLVFALVMRMVPKRDGLGRMPMNAERLFRFFFISMGVVYVGNIIGQLLMAGVSVITGKPMSNAVSVIIQQLDPLSLLLVVVLIAPVMEELVFRKFLLDRAAGYGGGQAILLSGLIFGLAHGNFYQFFYAFALGVLFAYVYLRTGKIRYTIGMHMAINFIGGSLPSYILKILASNMLLGAMLTMFQLMMMLGCIIAAVLILIYYRREIFGDLLAVCRFQKEDFKKIYGNWGMGFLLLVCIGGFILS